MRLVYIAHPYSADQDANAKRYDRLGKAIWAEYGGEAVPVSTIPMFPFMEKTCPEWEEEVMKIAYSLIDVCSELWVFGEKTKGVRLEIEYAQAQKKPIREVKIKSGGIL